MKSWTFWGLLLSVCYNHKLIWRSRTPWSYSLIFHALDLKVEGSNLAAAKNFFSSNQQKISLLKSEQKKKGTTLYRLWYAAAWHQLDLNIKGRVKSKKNKILIISWKNHPLLGFEPRNSHSTVCHFTICAISPHKLINIYHIWILGIIAGFKIAQESNVHKLNGYWIFKIKYPTKSKFI